MAPGTLNAPFCVLVMVGPEMMARAILSITTWTDQLALHGLSLTGTRETIMEQSQTRLLKIIQNDDYND